MEKSSTYCWRTRKWHIIPLTEPGMSAKRASWRRYYLKTHFKGMSRILPNEE